MVAGRVSTPRSAGSWPKSGSRSGRRVLEARHADEVIEDREAEHLAEHARPPEVQAGAGAHERGGAEEGGGDRPGARRRPCGGAADRDGGGRSEGEQRRGSVVLLAQHAQAEEETGGGERRETAGVEEAEQQQEHRELEQQRRARVVVHVPVREGPDAVDEHQRHRQPGGAVAGHAPEECEDQRHEERELDDQDPARDEVRGAEDPEGRGEQPEGPRERIDGRVAVELAALRDQVRKEEQVPLVHEAEPAIEEGELERQRDEEGAHHRRGLT